MLVGRLQATPADLACPQVKTSLPPIPTGLMSMHPAR